MNNGDTMIVIRNMITLFFLCSVLFFELKVFAQMGYALVGAKILVGDGSSIDNATLLIEKKRIIKIGQDIPISQGFEVINVAGHIITPGFIDSITEVGIVEVSLEDGANDALQKNAFIDPTLNMSIAVNRYSSVIPITRKEGVTSVIALPNGGFISGKGVWLDLHSDIHEKESVFSTFLSVSFGKEGTGSAQFTRSQILSKFVTMLDDTLWYLKNKKSYFENKTRTLSLSFQQLEAMVPIIQSDTPVLFFANRASDMLQIIKLTEQYHLKAVIAGACEGWMIADELKTSKISLILNPLQNAPDSFSSMGCRDDNAALLAQNGVSVIISTFDTHNSRLLRQYVGNAIRSGLSYEKALASVTYNPAIAFGQGDYGIIKEGVLANIVVWDSDPFELSSVAKMVFIHGKLQNNFTRQDALFGRYQHLYQPLWKPRHQ